MSMIYRPHAGDVIKADLINAIIDRLESITPKGDGKTIQVKKNPSGITISSFASGGTTLVPLLVGTHLIRDVTAQKIIYKGFYCTDFDGVNCTTWLDCYMCAIYNVALEDYEEDTTAWDFPANTILFGQLATYDLEYEPVYPLYVFDHPRWLE